jgi:hypothetical protein
VFTFGNPQCNTALYSSVTCPIMGNLLTVSNDYPVKAWWQFVYYVQLGIISTGTVPFTHQAYSWINVAPWCTAASYPHPSIGSMNVFNLVAPYYLTIAKWRGVVGGPYRLMHISGVGWLSSSKSNHCQSLP